MVGANRLQTTGSLGVLGCFVASEIAAQALASHPGSAVLWLVNLEIFGVFEQARAVPSPVRWLFGPASLPIAAALVVAAAMVDVYRVRLATAVIANLSFAGALSLGYTLFFCRSGLHTGWLLVASASARTDGCVVVALLLISAPAAVAGHCLLIRDLASERSTRGSRVARPARPSIVAQVV